jgi:hypothetical protein
MEEMTKAAAKCYEGVVSGLGHGTAACLWCGVDLP